jgi:hypothetical protein
MLWICGLLLGMSLGVVRTGLGAPTAAVHDEAVRQESFEDLLRRHKGLGVEEFRARYAPNPAGVDRLEIDLSKVLYLDPIQIRVKPWVAKQELTAPERRALAAQGLVLLESRAYPSFGDAFYDIFVNDQPLFVTSDAILHAFHKTYDRLLLELETLYLSPLLAEILRDGAAGVAQIRGSLGGDAVVSQAADDVEFLFTVAQELLKGSTDHNVPKVREVLRAVEAGKPLSVLFLGKPRDIDFSQFRPRGHYTKTVELQRYFRAMMWLGREDLSFRIGERFRETVAAFLMAAALKQGWAYAKWEEFDRQISFLVGAPDGANPRDLLALLGKLGYRNFGEFVLRAHPADILARIGEEKIGEQKILSAIVIKDPLAPPYRLPKSAQLMGQRFVIDSYLLHQLSYDRATGLLPRMMPQPLDLPASMGQPRAIDLLRPDLDRYGHQESLAACIEYAKGTPESFWKENVYHGWLDALREVGAPSAKGAPAVFQTRAWTDLKLQTQLASWAQLRHDTILYAKQSYSMGATCEYCDVYVEPNPRFFSKMAALCVRTASLLEEPATASKDAKMLFLKYKHHFTDFAAIMGRLQTVAEKELEGKPISAEERTFLKQAVQVRSGGCAGPRYLFSGWYPTLFANPNTCVEWEPTIADVHTQPTDENGAPVGRVLHVGVGNVNLAAIIVRGHDRQDRVFLGPVFSYYEMIESNFNRLTDEQWQERVGCPKAPMMLGSGYKPAKGPTPERPPWTAGLFGR